MKIEKDEILTFKLITGEEIVAKIVSVIDGMIVIKQPVSLVPGQQGLQMMPSLFSANLDKDVLLYASGILMTTEVREDVKAGYIKATTGIDVPAKKSIIVG